MTLRDLEISAPREHCCLPCTPAPRCHLIFWAWCRGHNAQRHCRFFERGIADLVPTASCSNDHGGATLRQRVITFHCIRSSASRRREEKAHAIGEVELTDTEAIVLTVEYRSELDIKRARERLAMLRKQNGIGTGSTMAGDDPSYMFERPAELWLKMQSELKRVYRLREVQHACFTFKVDAAVGLHKEGGRRAVIMNKTQFLHILKKAHGKEKDSDWDTRFFISPQGSNALVFRYDIALPHSVYLPPSFKKAQIEYPTPSAEEVR